MSRLRATEPVEVDIGPCECPDTPHDPDRAWLRPRLTPEGGMRATAILMSAFGRPQAEVEAELGMAFLEDGLVRWTLLDDAGEPVPATVETLRSGALDWATLYPIADKADELYAESVMRPLQERVRTSSPDGPTEDGTSAKTPPSRRSRKSSEPSTTATTPQSPPTGSPTDTDSS